MENAFNSSTCGNCSKSILLDILALHEAYCYRNISQCPNCEDMIDKNNKEEHNATHISVKCKHCSLSFSKNELENHEKQCSKKPKHCDFCNLNIDFKDWETHNYHCGSRTTNCEICGKFIILRELDQHVAFCFEELEKKEITKNPNNNNHHNKPKKNHFVEISDDESYEEKKGRNQKDKKKNKNDSDYEVDEDNTFHQGTKNSFREIFANGSAKKNYETRKSKNLNEGQKKTTKATDEDKYKKKLRNVNSINYTLENGGDSDDSQKMSLEHQVKRKIKDRSLKHEKNEREKLDLDLAKKLQLEEELYLDEKNGKQKKKK